MASSHAAPASSIARTVPVGWRDRSVELGTVGGLAAAVDRWRRADLFLLGAALAPFAVLAVVVAFVVGDDFRPASDLAMTEMHVRDVGVHDVLVGLHSRPFWSHPGPLQFYLSAPFYWLSGRASWGLVLSAVVINGAAVAGVLVLARRRGGTALMACAALGSLLLVRGLGPEMLGDASNLRLPVLPFLLFTLLAWSLLAGEVRLLALTAFVASFLVQTHILFGAVALPIALLAGAVALRRAHAAGQGRAAVRSAVGAAAVSAVVWAPPVLDMLLNQPSNARRIASYFRDTRDEPHGLLDAWRVVTGQFGFTSPWLTGRQRAGAVGESPFLVDPVVPLLLLPVIVAAVVVWRRGRQGPALVITLALVLGLTVLSVMRTLGVVIEYRLGYTRVPAALAAVVVLWALWLEVSHRWPGRAQALQGGLVAAACVVGVLAVIGSAGAEVPYPDESRVVDQLSDAALAEVGEVDGEVVVSDRFGPGGPMWSRGMVLQLERQGIDVRVDPGMWLYFSPARLAGDGTPATRLLLVDGDDAIERALTEPDLRLVVRLPDEEPNPDQVRWDRDAEALLERFAAGAITYEEYGDALDALPDPPPQPYGGAQVALFVDERPRPAAP